MKKKLILGMLLIASTIQANLNLKQVNQLLTSKKALTRKKLANITTSVNSFYAEATKKTKCDRDDFNTSTDLMGNLNNRLNVIYKKNHLTPQTLKTNSTYISIQNLYSKIETLNLNIRQKCVG